MWVPAECFQRDGRCSDTCAALKSRGLRATQHVNRNAVRVARAISLRTIPLPESSAATARDLGIAELDDTQNFGGLCRYIRTGTKGPCRRPHTGHASLLCTTHRGHVVVRRSNGEVVYYCSGCKGLVSTDLTTDGMCAACATISDQHDLALAEVEPTTPDPEAALSPSATHQIAGNCSQDSECILLSTEPASGSNAATSAAAASGQRTLPAPGRSLATTSAQPQALHSALPLAHAAAADDDTATADAHLHSDPVACKGENCGKPIRIGEALGGYCIICIVTILCQACALDLAVLATYPRSLKRSTGVCYSHRPHPPPRRHSNTLA